MSKRPLNAVRQAQMLEGNDAFFGGKRRAVNPDRPPAINSIIRPAASVTRRTNQIRTTSLPIQVSQFVPNNTSTSVDLGTLPELPAVPQRGLII